MTAGGRGRARRPGPARRGLATPPVLARRARGQPGNPFESLWGETSLQRRGRDGLLRGTRPAGLSPRLCCAICLYRAGRQPGRRIGMSILSELKAEFTTVVFTVLAVSFIFSAILTKNKTVSAFAQIGNLQERENSIRTLAENSHSFSITSQRLRDKICFTAGVLNVALTCYILGCSPTNFFYWHSPKAIILITLRWISFMNEKPARHYLLYDFCYWANFAALLYIWVMPHNATLFQIVFLASNGPLAWSILAFNQSLIFHSWQHITSVFIHVSPMLLTYGLRWYPDPRFTVCNAPPACDDVTAAPLFWNALSRFYIWWIVLYYVWIFLVLGSYIERRGFQTLYDRVSTSGPLSGLLRRLTVHHLIKKAVYISMHLLFGSATMLLATVFWHSREAHIAFLVAIFTASAWNASSHYFEVFSKKYELLLQNAERKGA